MADSMIERVAEAVLYEMMGSCEPGEAAPGWAEARRISRAAIAAMREPNDVMVEAELGYRLQFFEASGCQIESAEQAAMRDLVTRQWQTMIDALLSEDAVIHNPPA